MNNLPAQSNINPANSSMLPIDNIGLSDTGNGNINRWQKYQGISYQASISFDFFYDKEMLGYAAIMAFYNDNLLLNNISVRLNGRDYIGGFATTPSASMVRGFGLYSVTVQMMLAEVSGE